MWEYVVAFIIILIIGLAMAPKPQSSTPPGLGDIKAPTAEEGREIPVLFGTKVIEGPNVVWYGNLETVPIKKKA